MVAEPLLNGEPPGRYSRIALMTPLQLTRTGFVLIGTYFMLTGLVSPMAGALSMVLASQDPELSMEFGWKWLAFALPTLLFIAVPGAVLIWKSGQLAERVWPVADEETTPSISAKEVARIGIGLLGLYFVIEGLTGMVGGLAMIVILRSTPLLSELSFLYRPLVHGAASTLFGFLLFFKAHRLAGFLTRRA